MNSVHAELCFLHVNELGISRRSLPRWAPNKSPGPPGPCVRGLGVASLGSARPSRRRRRRRRRIPNKERKLRPPPPPAAAAPVTAGRRSRPVWAQDFRLWRSDTVDL